MEVTRIADGLWRWSTYYGEWREAVGSVHVEGDEAVVLVAREAIARALAA